MLVSTVVDRLKCRIDTLVPAKSYTTRGNLAECFWIGLKGNRGLANFRQVFGALILTQDPHCDPAADKKIENPCRRSEQKEDQYQFALFRYREPMHPRVSVSNFKTEAKR